MCSESAVIRTKHEVCVEQMFSRTDTAKRCRARHWLCVLYRAVLLQALRHASMQPCPSAALKDLRRSYWIACFITGGMNVGGMTNSAL